MTKENEAYLWAGIGDSDTCPRDVICIMLDKGMIRNPKQAWRTLEKWVNKNIYEYGTSLDLGWKLP